MPSPKLPCLLLTLPLLALPIGTAAVGPAAAAGASEEAVRILTRARATDAKCSYLSATERNELQRYSARAEIAATSQISAAAAKSAITAGKAESAGIACAADAETDVRETLDAARQANAAAKRVAEAPAPQNQKRPAAEPKAEAQQEPPRRTAKGLGYYARVVGAYYLERECRSLSRPEAGRFWRRITGLHQSTVAANGKRAVARVMANARSNAAGTSCSHNVQAQIRRGYEDILSR